MKPDHSPGRVAHAIVAVGGVPAVLLTYAVWCAFAIGSLGTLAWPLDLLANFRVQYLGLFALCTVVLTLARWRKTAIVALIGVVVTTASMAEYFPPPARALPSGPTFRLLTFNVWFRNDDFDRVATFLERSGADVIVLQEADLSRVAELQSALRSYPYHTATPQVHRGLVIFSRTPLRGVEHFEIPGRITRVTRVSTPWNGAEVAIIGTHLSWPITPSSTRQRAWELDLIADRVRLEAGPVLVAGDMNLTPWSGFFDRFVEQSGLRDCALGLGLLPTWPSQFWPVRIRIDHCFASEHWTARHISVGPGLGSDHFPVMTELVLATRDVR